MAYTLEVRGVSLRFGGVRALTDVSFGVHGRVVLHHRPERRRQDLDAQLHLRPLPADRAQLFYGARHHRPEAERARRPRHRPHLPEPRAVQPHEVLDNIMVGRHHLLKQQFRARDAVLGRRRAAGGARAPRARSRRSSTSWRSSTSARRPPARCPTACASASSWPARSRSKPELILLDEPMAGMNLEEKEDMARFIVDLNEEWGMTVVMIEHDMGVVMDISHRVMVLDFGRKIAEGDPEEVWPTRTSSAPTSARKTSCCVDARRRRAASRIRGMTHRAQSRRQPTRCPSCCACNAREHGDEVALREKEFGVWDLSPGPTSRRASRLRARRCAAWASARRRRRPHRRQPARLGAAARSPLTPSAP